VFARPTVIVVALFCVAAAAPAAKPDNPFLGTWTVTEAKPGPWVQPGEQALPVDPKILHAKITFTATSVTGPHPLGCARAVYELKTVEPEFLFEGGLPHPKEDARALGFATATFPAMSFSCERSDADLEMDYAMADKNTVMFGLNDRVYVMKRTPPR